MILVIEPIGCSLTDPRGQRSAPVASLASSAHGARTAGALLTGLLPGVFSLAALSPALSLLGLSLLAVAIDRVPSEVAARAVGATATINPATNPAATVDAPSRPVIRISFPSACPNAFQRILPVRPVCGGRLRLNFLRTGTRLRPERGRPTSPFG